MPHVTETPIKAYAHCLCARCPGYDQEPVEALSHETHWLFKDNGGDLPGVERSHIILKFAPVDEDDPDAVDQSVCEHCGGPRELSEKPRPQYINESGHDPMYLVSANARPYSAAKQTEAQSARVQDLEAQVAALTKLVEQSVGKAA